MYIKKMFENIKSKGKDLVDKVRLEYEMIKFNLEPVKAKTILGAGAATSGMIMLPEISPAQTIEYKASDGLINLAGTAKDGNGTAVNNATATLYEGGIEVASGAVENGAYLIEDILLTGTTLNTDREFWVKQNSPNPFGESTDINFSLDKKERVLIEMYDLQGKKVKTIENKELGPGVHNTKVDASGLSDGIYIYRLIAGDKAVTNKMIHLSGGPESTGMTPTPEYKSVNTEFTLEISGEDHFTKDTTLQLYGTGTITVPTLTVIEKPLVTGLVYDLDTKWDEDGNRLVPQGIQGMIAYLGSNPEIQTTTDEEGRFYLRIPYIPANPDSIYVVGANEADTAYYFWGYPGPSPNISGNGNPPLIIGPDTNYISAFNDTTGIPLFPRQWYEEDGVGLLEHIIYSANVEGKFVGFETWENITSRARDEDMTHPVWGDGIRVFMNRDIAPNDWYADSSWAGLKGAEEKRFKFVEVDNIDDALLIMEYDHDVPGQGVDIEGEWDEMGPYLTSYTIKISGPPGGPALSQDDTPYVVAHEAMHIAYGGGGNHSPYIEDNFWMDAFGKFDLSLPLDGSERERRTVQVYWDLERNPKFLHYFSENPLLTYKSTGMDNEKNKEGLQREINKLIK